MLNSGQYKLGEEESNRKLAKFYDQNIELTESDEDEQFEGPPKRPRDPVTGEELPRRPTYDAAAVAKQERELRKADKRREREANARIHESTVLEREDRAARKERHLAEVRAKWEEESAKRVEGIAVKPPPTYMPKIPSEPLLLVPAGQTPEGMALAKPKTPGAPCEYCKTVHTGLCPPGTGDTVKGKGKGKKGKKGKRTRDPGAPAEEPEGRFGDPPDYIPSEELSPVAEPEAVPRASSALALEDVDLN